MSSPLSDKEYERMGNTNAAAGFALLEHLLDNPDQITSIPEGAYVFQLTGDPWVDEQNRILAANQNDKVFWTKIPVPVLQD
jgi:hypothetical protein